MIDGGIRMGLFNRRTIDLNEIVSVIILEQTQNYRKSKAKAGLMFGDSLFSPDVIFMEGNSEPAGCTYTFSVTYKDGHKEIIKANSGTDLCDGLLQKALEQETATFMEIHSQLNTPPQKVPALQKNQLPQGVYRIGEDIPAGTYDFHHVWGHGFLQLCTAKETTNANTKFFEWIGDQKTYEKLDCLHIRCEEGWYLHINGNLIVEIEKSKKVRIDL